jgi:hypothetical protein
LVCAGVLSHHGAAHLVECIVHEPLHVEAIENERRSRRVGLHRLDVRLGHVEGDGQQALTAFGPQLCEEQIERRGVLALVSPDDLAGLVVGDDGDALVMAPLSGLVDADVAEPLESVLGVLTSHDARDDVADRTPGDAHQPDDRRLVGALSEVGDLLFERAREHRVGSAQGTISVRTPQRAQFTRRRS